MDTPKRRGRPPKAKAVPPSPQKDTEPAPVATVPPPRGTRGQAPFLFKLVGYGTQAMLGLLDGKGRPVSPDYRSYSGAVREALRAFDAERVRQRDGLRIFTFESSIDEGWIEPSSRTLDAAALAGLLSGNVRLLPAEGIHRLTLIITERAGGAAGVEPALIGEDGEVSVGSLQTVTENRVVLGDKLYRTEDLGPSWHEAASLSAQIDRTQLPVFLSIALSRFPSLLIRYDPYVTSIGRPRVAKPALVFQEIDAYGYLHVVPRSYVSGYPLGFFEEQDVVKVVEFDDEEKQIFVSEVVFPTLSDAEFRKLLDSCGKDAKSAVYEEGGHFILEPSFAERFVSDHMGGLVATFALFESSVLARYKLSASVPKLRLSVKTGIDYLEAGAEVVVDGQTFSYGRFLAEYRKTGFVTLSDGTRSFPDAAAVSRFERLIARTKGDDEVEISIFDFPSLAEDAEVQADSEAWRKAEGFYRGIGALKDRPLVCPLAGGNRLRPYQEYGVKWLSHLRDYSLGGCLADEMGLGKTVQVISLLKLTYAGGMKEPSLVVAPRSLLFNWMAELKRFAPELEVLVHYGNKRDTEAIGGASRLVVLTSYATLRNDIADLQAIQFGYAILDESQSIKNLGTQTSAAALKIDARHRLALSGTPVENNLTELYSLFRFLNPTFFGTMTEFAKAYLRPIQERGDEDALRDLKARIYPFMLRRLKRDVLKDLPPKTEQTALIELDAAHMAVYESRRLELNERVRRIMARDGIHKGAFEIMLAMAELRRLAGVPESDGEYGGVSAKREYLNETVSGIVESGHKCLVFTNYLASVELVAGDLSGAGIGTLVMTGATNDRQSLVNRFQTDPLTKAFVMTLKTGGVGLNLTAADYVFIFDPWWNRSVEAQAIDRTHRIGQTNPVFCYRMIAKGTIEEKMLELQERKAGLISSLLSSDAEAIKALDESDIEYLLG